MTGTRSLTVALKKRLYAGGIKLANGPAANVYMVKGSVKLVEASGGKQSIRIDWQVLTLAARSSARCRSRTPSPRVR